MLYRTPFKTPSELGISADDLRGLVLVLDGLEDGTIRDDEFDMSRWDSCICGWARKLMDGYAFISLPHWMTNRLFCTGGAARVTCAEAAIVLRHYLLTGEVDWSLRGA
jgi:hypothetical protein